MKARAAATLLTVLTTITVSGQESLSSIADSLFANAPTELHYWKEPLDRSHLSTRGSFSPLMISDGLISEFAIVESVFAVNEGGVSTHYFWWIDHEGSDPIDLVPASGVSMMQSSYSGPAMPSDEVEERLGAAAALALEYSRLEEEHEGLLGGALASAIYACIFAAGAGIDYVLAREFTDTQATLLGLTAVSVGLGGTFLVLDIPNRHDWREVDSKLRQTWR